MERVEIKRKTKGKTNKKETKNKILINKSLSRKNRRQKIKNNDIIKIKF